MCLSSHKFSCDFMNNFTEIKHFNQVSGIDLCTIESKAAILFFKSSIRGGEKVKNLATSQTEHNSMMKIGDGIFFFLIGIFKGESVSCSSQLFTYFRKQLEGLEEGDSEVLNETEIGTTICLVPLPRRDRRLGPACKEPGFLG